MKDLYETNKDFKAYIDKYCAKHGIGVDEALTHSIPQAVGKISAALLSSKTKSEGEKK